MTMVLYQSSLTVGLRIQAHWSEAGYWPDVKVSNEPEGTKSAAQQFAIYRNMRECINERERERER